MRGIIYKYTSPSGKCYIGQTSQENKRKYRFENIKQSYGSPKINNARKKYGPENFEYEILFEISIDDKDELRKILGEKEIIYIKQFDTINNGYNYQEGGIHKVNVLSPESRKQAALKVSKAILQYSIKGVFMREWISTMDIERELGINHTLISQNCLGKTKHCRNFVFKHKLNEAIELEIKVENIKIKKTKWLSITQYDINGLAINTWKTISEAGRELNIDRHTLKKITESKKVYNGFTYIINE